MHLGVDYLFMLPGGISSMVCACYDAIAIRLDALVTNVVCIFYPNDPSTLIALNH